MQLPSLLAVAAASQPAGGAAIGQVVIATSFATAATAGLLSPTTSLRADPPSARPPVAPAPRPGRHALGPDAPDALRGRLDDADRPGRAAAGGHARPARGAP